MFFPLIRFKQMTIQGTATASIPRDRVFAALLDGEVLKSILPGCEEFAPCGENVFRIKVSAGVGGLRGSAEGTVTVNESRPPEHYTLAFSAKGVGSSIEGTATIDLTEATQIAYRADFNVGGLISAIGDRMIEKAAVKAITHFLQRLQDQM